MSTLADALRVNLQNLDEAIRHSRICIRKGDKRKAEFLSEYLRLVRYVDELKRERQAESNIWLALCEQHLPMPFCEQVVGKNKFAREWDMAAMAVPPVTAAPIALKHQRAA